MLDAVLDFFRFAVVDAGLLLLISMASATNPNAASMSCKHVRLGMWHEDTTP